MSREVSVEKLEDGDGSKVLSKTEVTVEYGVRMDGEESVAWHAVGRLVVEIELNPPRVPRGVAI